MPGSTVNGPSGLSTVHVPPGKESTSDTPEIVVAFGFSTVITPLTTNAESFAADGVTTPSYSTVAEVPAGTVCDGSPATDYSIDQS